MAKHDHQQFQKHLRRPRETTLYRGYDSAGVLLYIGIAYTIQDRIRQHVRDSSWMQYASTITIDRFPTREAAETAERAAIQAEKPIFNTSMAGSLPDTIARISSYNAPDNAIGDLTSRIRLASKRENDALAERDRALKTYLDLNRINQDLIREIQSSKKETNSAKQESERWKMTTQALTRRNLWQRIRNKAIPNGLPQT